MGLNKLSGVIFVILLVLSLGITTIPARGTMLSGNSQTQASSDDPVLHIAQTSVGQCRQLRRLERVYSAADLASARINDLDTGTTVTLAGEPNQPSYGWIRISYPYTGYIQTAFLVQCGSQLPTPTASSPAPTPTPTTPSPTPVATPPSSPTPTSPLPPPTNGCGIAQIDLSIRSQPSTEAALTGTFIPTGQGFRIVSSERRIQSLPPSQSGRAWIQVNYNSVTGWIAETGPNGEGANIRRINCASIS